MQIDKIAEVVRDWIRGGQYEQAYPEINKRNVFSISTLSYSVEKQVAWKFDKERKGHEVNPFMFHGKAVHEYFQKRLGNLDGWGFEHEIFTKVPYKWAKHPFDHIKLLGHVDAVNLSEKQLFEFKSTIFPLQRGATAKIKPWEIMQAGTYSVILSEKYGTFIQPIIIKVNHGILVHPLTQRETWEAYWGLLHRAFDTARQVDVDV